MSLIWPEPECWGPTLRVSVCAPGSSGLADPRTLSGTGLSVVVNVSQSVGNLASLRMGGGPSQLSFRNSFSGLGWPSNWSPNISMDSRSKFSTPGQILTRDIAFGVFRGTRSEEHTSELQSP